MRFEHILAANSSSISLAVCLLIGGLVLIENLQTISSIGNNISYWGLGIYVSDNVESENQSPIPNCLKYHQFKILIWGYHTWMGIFSVSPLIPFVKKLPLLILEYKSNTWYFTIIIVTVVTVVTVRTVVTVVEVVTAVTVVKVVTVVTKVTTTKNHTQKINK